MNNEIETQFNLGQWLGRHQAFAVVTSFCSSADAHALLTIREQKLYRALGLTWEEFCSQHMGFTARTAERTIASLKEFGEAFFNLREIVPLPAADYRAAIQPAVEDNTIEFEGRRIEINRENTQQLLEAVQKLRAQAESRKLSARSPLDDLEKALDRVRGQASGLIARCEGLDHDLILLLIDDHISRFHDLFRSEGYEVIDPLSQTEPQETAAPAA